MTRECTRDSMGGVIGRRRAGIQDRASGPRGRGSRGEGVGIRDKWDSVRD